MKNFKTGERFKIIAGDLEGMTGLPWRPRKCDDLWWVTIDGLHERPDLWSYAPFINNTGEQNQLCVLLPPWLCEVAA